jgi:hypothetical protein
MFDIDPKNDDDARLIAETVDWENVTYDEIVFLGESSKILAVRAHEEVNRRESAGTLDKKALGAAVHAYLVQKQKQAEQYEKFHKEMLIQFFNNRGNK